jgi:hypothetical protein
VWYGFIDDQLYGPFTLEGYLITDSYLHFLQDELPLILEDVPVPFQIKHVTATHWWSTSFWSVSLSLVELMLWKSLDWSRRSTWLVVLFTSLDTPGFLHGGLHEELYISGKIVDMG